MQPGIPLRNIKADMFLKELALFSQVEFKKQVIVDQGISFMSETLKAIWRYVWVHPT